MPAKTKTYPTAIRHEKQPKEWPEEVQFLTDQTYSAAVTLDAQVALGRTTAESATYPKIAADQIVVPCPLMKIRVIDDEKHPAKGQRGLFATKHLEPDAFLCLYLGHVHMNTLTDTSSESDFDLSLDRELGLSVDAERSGNESRFANDYRGITDRPNAEFRDCLIQVKSDKRADGVKWERRVGIFVLSAGKAGLRKGGIKAGEEICVSYGSSYWMCRKQMATFRKDDEMLRIANAALDA